MRQGFSLVELVAVILIIGVITVFASARIASSPHKTRAFFDELLTQVQYARKVAVAQRRAVSVRIGASDSRLCYSAAGACDAVASPTGQSAFILAIPSGVSVAPLTFQFDALGRPRDGDPMSTLRTTPLVIDVVGDGTLQFTVDHETGYAR